MLLEGKHCISELSQMLIRGRHSTTLISLYLTFSKVSHNLEPEKYTNLYKMQIFILTLNDSIVKQYYETAL